MILKRFFTVAFIFLSSILYLNAEEFIPKLGSYEKNGKKIEIRNLSGLPTFYANYYPTQNIVKIKCSLGNLILKRAEGAFFYAYRGKHKGFLVTVTAYVKDRILESIVYEEWDNIQNIKVIVGYYKK